MRLSTVLLFLGLLIAVPARAIRGQSHWDAYKPGTITAVMNQHDSIVPGDSADGRTSVMVSGDDFPTLARVIYRGESRPLDARRALVMREWSLAFLRDTSMLNDFHREYLFQEGKRALWLPVQDTVASFFSRELRPGQAVRLYVIFLGARREPKEIFWAFAVNEFKAEAYVEKAK